VIVGSSAEVVAASGLPEDRQGQLNCLLRRLEHFVAVAVGSGRCLKASAVWHYPIDRPNWLGWRQGVQQHVVDRFGLLRIEVERIEDFGLGVAFLAASLEEQALLRSSVPDLGTRLALAGLAGAASAAVAGAGTAVLVEVLDLDGSDHDGC